MLGRHLEKLAYPVPLPLPAPAGCACQSFKGHWSGGMFEIVISRVHGQVVPDAKLRKEGIIVEKANCAEARETRHSCQRKGSIATALRLVVISRLMVSRIARRTPDAAGHDLWHWSFCT